jgi:hypothetical protein
MAVGRGSLIKAAVDTFLPTLREKLGFPPTANRKEEKELWQLFSNTITYRLKLDELNHKLD